jgi:uncharacterized protein (UPF0332 family)
VKPETISFFRQATKLLVEADLMIEVGLFEAAGRNAYLAGCFAARGLIFEDCNKTANQHRRLWGDLTEILKKRGVGAPALTAFLPNAYSLKRIADYETGASEITRERAQRAVDDATEYVGRLHHIARNPVP